MKTRVTYLIVLLLPLSHCECCKLRAVSLFQQHLSGVEVDIKCHHQLNEENEKGLSAQNAAT